MQETEVVNLFNDISNYDESLVNFKFSEVHRHTEIIETEEIDFRKYDRVKERVHFASSEIDSQNILSLTHFIHYFHLYIVNNINLELSFLILAFSKSYISLIVYYHEKKKKFSYLIIFFIIMQNFNQKFFT